MKIIALAASAAFALSAFDAPAVAQMDRHDDHSMNADRHDDHGDHHMMMRHHHHHCHWVWHHHHHMRVC